MVLPHNDKCQLLIKVENLWDQVGGVPVSSLLHHDDVSSGIVVLSWAFLTIGTAPTLIIHSTCIPPSALHTHSRLYPEREAKIPLYSVHTVMLALLLHSPPLPWQWTLSSGSHLLPTYMTHKNYYYYFTYFFFFF